MIAHRGVRILLVEDDPDDYILTRDLLAESGDSKYHLRWASTREDALRAVDDEEIDAVLLDYRLGETTGLDLLHQLAGDDHGLPVILLTGQDDPELDLEAMLAGAADYLVKGEINARLLERSIRYAVEWKRAREALRRREQVFRALVEHAPDAILRFDGRLRHVYLNPSAERMLGLDGPTAVGRTHGELPVPEETRQALEEALRRVFATGREEHLQLRYAGPRGERWYQARIVPELAPDHSVEWVLAVARDVTEQKRTDEAFAESQRQLLQSQKMDTIGRLASGIAHDVNNMLAVIKGFASLLELGVEDAEEERHYLREIQRAADRSAGLTRQILAYSRRQMMQLERVALNPWLTETRPVLQRLIGEQVVLRTSLDPALPPVEVDPNQLHQVLLNLATNARDAMPAGGELLVETRSRRLDEEDARAYPPMPPGPYVELVVRDTGCGMDERVLPRIFEPFFTTKPVGQGTGLGLSTVYGIIKQSGGFVFAESQPGAGSTFRIFLPPLAAPPRDPDAAPPPRAEAATILLVEDEPAVRSMVRVLLEREGHRVLQAQDGEHALGVYEAHGGRIDLLMTDVVMPRLSGPLLARRVTAVAPTLPVLYLSGYSEEARNRHGALEPGTFFLEKPFAPEALLRKVGQALASRAR